MPWSSELFPACDDVEAADAESVGDRQSDIRSLGPDPELRATARGIPEGPPEVAKAENLAPHAARIAKHHPGARVLDAGSGSWSFLEAALELGLDAHGVDASESRVLTVSPRFGNRVKCGTLTSIANAGAGFDVVFAPHLLEHCATPRELAFQLRNLLKPGGELWAITANARSLSARLGRPPRTRATDRAPLVLYGKEQLQRLLEPHFRSIRVSRSAGEYPVRLLAERLGELFEPARRLTHFASTGLRDLTVHLPDGNLLVRAKRI